MLAAGDQEKQALKTNPGENGKLDPTTAFPKPFERFFMIGYLIFVALLVAGDQLIKLWAQEVLKPLASIGLIPGVLSLTYHQNFGAAWGILQGQRWLLLAVTGVVIAGLLAALVTGRLQGRLLNLSASLIVAGGLGNLLDRAFHTGGFVVDYIYFELIDYPIFNLADSCVCVGTFLLAYYILFVDGKEPKKAVEGEPLPPAEAMGDAGPSAPDESGGTPEASGADGSDAPADTPDASDTSQPPWES